MSDTWVVIPAAGKSQRFKNVGYAGNKAELKIQPSWTTAREMIRFVIDTVPSTVSSSKIIVGIPPSWSTALPTIVQMITHSTGQADTVHQLIRELPKDDRVLVLDCDMLVNAIDQQTLINMLNQFDMTVAVTETFDPNFSRVDQVPHPLRIVEKEPISQWGIVGARGFNNIGILTSVLQGILVGIRSKEQYLSMAMNDYPGKKYAHVVHDYWDLGTPERIKENGWTIV